MSQYPELSAILAKVDVKDKNAVLLEVRKSLRSILSQLFLFLFTLSVVLALNVIWPHGNLLGLFTNERFISLRWLGIIPLLVFLELLRRYHDDLYCFTQHTLTHFDGRLSLNYTVPNIRYVDIRAVIVSQDIWGRILDYGNIELDTAAQEKAEMLLEGVRDPTCLAEIIEGLRQNSATLEEPTVVNRTSNND